MIDHGDGLPDDRIVCTDCRHSDPEHYWCRSLRTSILPDVPLRCMSFEPLHFVADQRTGVQRWPTLQRDIAEVRAIDAKHIATLRGKPRCEARARGPLTGSPTPKART
jgi:hypothetical protein